MEIQRTKFEQTGFELCDDIAVASVYLVEGDASGIELESSVEKELQRFSQEIWTKLKISSGDAIGLYTRLTDASSKETSVWRGDIDAQYISPILSKVFPVSVMKTPSVFAVNWGETYREEGSSIVSMRYEDDRVDDFVKKLIEGFYNEFMRVSPFSMINHVVAGVICVRIVYGLTGKFLKFPNIQNVTDNERFQSFTPDLDIDIRY